jgi:lactoylglutathione lyase
MKIEHIAIRTIDLEALKDFYVKYFNGKPNQKYRNPKTQLESYFVSFDSGCRLELMTVPDIKERNDNQLNDQGMTHFAFEMKSKLEVDSKAEELKSAGFPILRGPRITGDGYYEFETIDTDGNKIEITAENQ